MVLTRRVDPGLRDAAKSALRQCLRIVASVQVRTIWRYGRHVSSKPLLYALADDTRANVPSGAELIEDADAMLSASTRLAEGAAELYRVAEAMAEEGASARAA